MSRPVRSLASLLVFVVVVATAGAAHPAPRSSADALWKPVVDAAVDPMVDLDEYEDRVLAAINRKRAKADLPRVRFFHQCADLIAEAWAVKLSVLGDLVHRDPHVLLRRCDYDWAGETLVRGTGLTPRAAVRAWLASRTHRAVLMKRRADRAGIGTVLGLDGRLYTVLNFGDAPPAR